MKLAAVVNQEMQFSVIAPGLVYQVRFPFSVDAMAVINEVVNEDLAYIQTVDGKAELRDDLLKSGYDSSVEVPISNRLLRDKIVILRPDRVPKLDFYEAHVTAESEHAWLLPIISDILKIKGFVTGTDGLSVRAEFIIQRQIRRDGSKVSPHCDHFQYGQRNGYASHFSMSVDVTPPSIRDHFSGSDLVLYSSSECVSLPSVTAPYAHVNAGTFFKNDQGITHITTPIQVKTPLIETDEGRYVARYLCNVLIHFE